MRFLKGMLARSSEEPQVGEAYGAYGPDEDHSGTNDLWDDEFDATEGDMDRDATIAENEQPVAMDGGPEENGPGSAPGGPASTDGAEIPADAGPGRRASAPRTGELGGVRIWEMFDEEGDTESGGLGELGTAPVSRPAPKVHDGDEPPTPSQNELAREAMQAIQARAFETPDPGAAAPAAVGRTKTRVLGFAAREAMGADLFDQPKKAPVKGICHFPVGWIVVIEGPGRGAAFPLQNGVSQIGRGDGQSIQLNFGDTAISRENHASIAYDEEQNMFYIGHGGKANIVRLNGRPVLSTEELANTDMIRIGETTLRFVALCGPDFAWDLTE